MILEKLCKGCGEVKPVSEFFKKATSSDGYRHKCKACWAESTKKYRAENREQIKLWPSYSDDKQRARSRAHSKAHYKDNPDSERLRKKIYRQQHREQMLQRDARYREEHKAVRRAQSARRRAAEREAEGVFSGAQWEKILNHYAPDGKCLCCGKVAQLTVDHVVPLSLGGSNYPSNLQPLCLTCNLTKHAHIKDYRLDNGTFALSINS